VIEPRSHLLPLQQQGLLAAAKIRSKRDYALFTLALGTGLSARAISYLNVGHVSKDGINIVPELNIGRCDRRTFAANDNGLVILPKYVRLVLARHLRRTKRMCPHFERPMRTVADADGSARCETCGHQIDFMKLPLFLSRFRDRLSTRRMRSLFEEYRKTLWLPGHLHFDSLKETFDAGRVTNLNAA
jgi:hypothetical protein